MYASTHSQRVPKLHMRDTFLLTTNWASSLTVPPFIQEEIPTSITNKSFALPRLARRFRPWFQLVRNLLKPETKKAALADGL